MWKFQKMVLTAPKNAARFRNHGNLVFGPTLQVFKGRYVNVVFALFANVWLEHLAPKDLKCETGHGKWKTGGATEGH